jgi:hypothetical protein
MLMGVNFRLRMLKYRVIFLAAICLFVSALPVSADSVSTDPVSTDNEGVIKKLNHLMENCGFNYQNPALNIWSIPVEAKSRVWKVILSGSEKENIAFFLNKIADLPPKISPEFLKTLLELNYDYDKGKFVLSEGTLYFRIDVTLRILDVEELKSDINQCAIAADDIYPKIAPFLEEATLPQSVPR